MLIYRFGAHVRDLGMPGARIVVVGKRFECRSHRVLDACHAP